MQSMGETGVGAHALRGTPRVLLAQNMQSMGETVAGAHALHETPVCFSRKTCKACKAWAVNGRAATVGRASETGPVAIGDEVAGPSRMPR
jgi:hypothetical protein